MTAIIALSTAPDVDSARHIAAALLEKRLAACVQIVPAIESLYRWDNAVQRDTEYQLVIKTTAAASERAREALSQLHPYDVPQWLTIDSVSGSEAYLHWLQSEVADTK